jgi:hypothetical protein
VKISTFLSKIVAVALLFMAIAGNFGEIAAKGVFGFGRLKVVMIFVADEEEKQLAFLDSVYFIRKYEYLEDLLHDY